MFFFSDNILGHKRCKNFLTNWLPWASNRALTRISVDATQKTAHVSPIVGCHTDFCGYIDIFSPPVHIKSITTNWSLSIFNRSQWEPYNMLMAYIVPYFIFFHTWNTWCSRMIVYCNHKISYICYVLLLATD